MARRKVRTGVRTSIRTLKSMAVLFRKAANLMLAEANRLKKTDSRIIRLRVQATKKTRRRNARRPTSRPAYKGMRGGPSLVELALQILSTRKRPMKIKDLANRVLAKKSGAKPGIHFVQNLGLRIGADPRFVRVSRGVYTVKR